VTDDNSLILDYASPRKRVRFRLPATSSLLLRGDADEVVITEKLIGDHGAIPALLFAGFVLIATSVLLSPIFNDRVYANEVVFWIVQAVVQILVMVMLIQQTWRMTVLTIHYEQLRLAFTSPLRNRQYQFSGEQIAEMRITETANLETPAALGELILVRTNGGEIHLFTDHNSRELGGLLGAIEAMLHQGKWLPPAVNPLKVMAVSPPPALPAVSPDLESNAMATTIRLLDHQRQVSEKLRPRE